MTEESIKRYRYTRRCLDVMQGLMRSYSKCGRNVEPAEGFEAAWDEMQGICDMLREWMLKYRYEGDDEHGAGGADQQG